MTQEQYDRWKDFARRMVNVAVSARKRSPSRAFTLEIINFFFECRMGPHDEWKRVVSWDHTEKEEGSNDWPMCVGDHMSDIEEYNVPSYWSIPDGERGQDIIDKWMGPARCCVRAGLDLAVAPSMGVMGFTAGDIRKMYPEGVPDWVTGGKDHHWTNQPITGIVPGIGLTMGEEEVNGTFAEMPDDTPIWI